jgi:hypothetical protein
LSTFLFLFKTHNVLGLVSVQLQLEPTNLEPISRAVPYILPSFDLVSVDKDWFYWLDPIE